MVTFVINKHNLQVSECRERINIRTHNRDVYKRQILNSVMYRFQPQNAIRYVNRITVTINDNNDKVSSVYRILSKADFIKMYPHKIYAKFIYYYVVCSQYCRYFFLNELTNFNCTNAFSRLTELFS